LQGNKTPIIHENVTIILCVLPTDRFVPGKYSEKYTNRSKNERIPVWLTRPYRDPFREKER
jgi:hypothetical protein